MNMFLYLTTIRSIVAIILIILPLNMLFAQSLSDKWKCSTKMLNEMELGYYSLNGKCHFKDNGIFYVIINGRSLLGHKFWPYRTMYAKLKGNYHIVGDSIYSNIDHKDIKVNVEPGIDDPEFNSDIKQKEENTTWDFAKIKYASIKSQCRIQEKVIKEKLYNLWTWNKAHIIFSKETLDIGDLIKLKR